MQFYKFEGLIFDDAFSDDYDNHKVKRGKIRGLSKLTDRFNSRLHQAAYVFISDISNDSALIGLITKGSINEKKLVDDYLKAASLTVSDISQNEITFGSICNMLEDASRGGYIVDDDDDILGKFGLNILASRYEMFNNGCLEDVFNENTKSEIYRELNEYLVKGSFTPELNRIYEGSAMKKTYGIPVHYMVETDDKSTRKDLCILLMQALHANKRIRNKRFCVLNINPERDFSKKYYECLYKSNEGGTVIINYLPRIGEEGVFADTGRDFIENMSEIIKDYSNRVLTVICLHRECNSEKDIFFENLGNMSFIEIKEDFVYNDVARDFLKIIAARNNVRTDKKLFAKIEQDKGYLTPDLQVLFDEWYASKLKTSIYPQYKDIVATRRNVAKKAPKGNAFDELNEMIGLTSAKTVIKNALDYFKAQKLFADKGLKNDHPSMHMVFTGNPGTAKTTVARLVARIFKDNDILSKGHLVEVGRSELVGKYVGWTAPTIKKKFEEAKGSVLFIDEAYSLVDDRNGSYGDEAINTIVQEMENHRDDVVVIFAGYPDKMEEFLKKNPGLRSRIAFHVNFDDYNADELCDIAKLISKQKGVALTDEAINKLHGIFETARVQSDFGNGRFVRNILEKAKMVQASRLLHVADYDSLLLSDFKTITADDIDAPLNSEAHETKKIGFCA